jgi:polyisoprenoid-binding protein YceI
MNRNIILIILGLAVIAYGVYDLTNNQGEENLDLGSNTIINTENNGQNGDLVNNDEETDSSEVSQEVEDGTYQINAEESQVNWQGERVLAEHTGTVEVKLGEFVIENNELVSGNVVIDMTTIITDENIESLENHLKNDDFFNVSDYPEASLELTIVEKITGSQEYQASGDMTIKGITNEISFPVILKEADNGLVLESSFSVDRTNWGVNFRSGKFFQDLGDNLIRDEINFQIILTGERQD